MIPKRKYRGGAFSCKKHPFRAINTTRRKSLLDDLSYRQIAEVLGISESNVGVKLNRAKNALGGLMKEVFHES